MSVLQRWGPGKGEPRRTAVILWGPARQYPR